MIKSGFLPEFYEQMYCGL